jgi:tRNA(adenine34) deaminase
MALIWNIIGDLLISPIKLYPMSEQNQAQRDEKFMRMAINEALKALKQEEVPIGAVVVCGDQIIGRGHNLVESLCDATAHAEMQAITAAASTLGGKYLKGCTIYVTVEPCIMCAGALAWSQIGRIVYGASDAKRGFSTISNNMLHPRTVVTSGVLREECERLMTDFFAKLR